MMEGEGKERRLTKNTFRVRKKVNGGDTEKRKKKEKGKRKKVGVQRAYSQPPYPQQPTAL